MKYAFMIDDSGIEALIIAKSYAAALEIYREKLKSEYQSELKTGEMTYGEIEEEVAKVQNGPIRMFISETHKGLFWRMIDSHQEGIEWFGRKKWTKIVGFEVPYVPDEA